jgi:hypothetical protein
MIVALSREPPSDSTFFDFCVGTPAARRDFTRRSTK